MKNKLKRHLQFRFVLLSMSAIAILLISIVGFSIWLNYHQITKNADRLIVLSRTNPASPELESLHYISAIYKIEEKSIDIDLSHSSLNKKELINGYIKTIMNNKKDKGYINNYRYILYRTQKEIRVTLLSRQANLEALKNNAISLITTSLCGMLITLIILIIISGNVVEPLVKNSQRQKEFITSASHELKTPITVINADGELLKEQIGNNKWLEDILKQNNILKDMTNRLVYLTNVEEKDDFFTMIDFPISDLVENISSSFMSIAKKDNKKFEIDIENNLSYIGDERAIRELITILLDNAFKYVSKQGDIKLSLKKEKNYIKLIVQNSIENIDSKEIEKFTDRFYRGSNSGKAKGFGIGLAVGKAIVEAHKGELRSEIIDGKRINFIVILK